MKITDIENIEELKKCLLSNDAFFTNNIPSYIDFELLLIVISRSETKIIKPQEKYNLSYDILVKKNSNSWRKITLLNPVLYVAGVNLLAENWAEVRCRFGELTSGSRKVSVYSIPSFGSREDGGYTKDLAGWNNFNNSVAEKAMKYKFITETDISNFYGSIYTHSLDWAVRGKNEAKENRKQKCFGGKLDEYFRSLNYGQTVSIPQGNVLSDFAAELLLAYIDKEIMDFIEAQGISGFEISRYRDDYRVFTNFIEDAEKITKIIAEILFEFNLVLNKEKTKIGISSSDYLTNSENVDFLKLLPAINKTADLANRLTIILDFSKKFIDSKKLKPLLRTVFDGNNLRGELNVNEQNIAKIIFVLSEIIKENPRVYDDGALIFANLLRDDNLSEDTKMNIINAMKSLANESIDREFLSLWIQKALLYNNIDFMPAEESKLARAIYGQKESYNHIDEVWDLSSLSEDDIESLLCIPIFDEDVINEWLGYNVDWEYYF